MRDLVIEFLNDNLPNDYNYESLLSKPKILEHGDFSLPVFTIAKDLKLNPVDYAKKLELELVSILPSSISKVIAMGPFLNFYLDTNKECKNIVQGLEEGTFLNYKIKEKQNILIEYPSPNTNKSLHLGHTRNLLLGNALRNILKEVGVNVIAFNMNNDRGIAVCKAMLSYKLFGDNKTPESEKIKPDEFVSNYYTLFENKAKEDPSLNDLAQEMLVDWENSKEDVVDLWKKILGWVLDGYKTTLKNYNYVADIECFESKIYKEGKDIVLEGLKNGVFKKEADGAVYCDLGDMDLGKKYLLRGDGTTLYMTQDLYLDSFKKSKFDFTKSVFIVGQEQKYHFDVLFEILKRLGRDDGTRNYHFAYGMVYDKDGKKFSSRKGNAISADEILNLFVVKAYKNLIQRDNSLTKEVLKQRSKIIGYGALAFGILKQNPLSDIKFDIDKALAFEGETGPYVQYTYARINSILKKSKLKGIKVDDIDYSKYQEKDYELLKSLKEFSLVLEDVYLKYKISGIANYLIKVCKLFNDFYQNSNILKSGHDEMIARLKLCELTAKVIKKGLKLLDIETLDEM